MSNDKSYVEKICQENGRRGVGGHLVGILYKVAGKVLADKVISEQRLEVSESINLLDI